MSILQINKLNKNHVNESVQRFNFPHGSNSMDVNLNNLWKHCQSCVGLHRLRDTFSLNNIQGINFSLYLPKTGSILAADQHEAWSYFQWNWRLPWMVLRSYRDLGYVLCVRTLSAIEIYLYIRLQLISLLFLLMCGSWHTYFLGSLIMLQIVLKQ